jgi:DNA-binding NtrC family response regulator
MKQVHYPTSPVLLVDDEEDLLRSLSMVLRSGGIGHVETCSRAVEVHQLLARQTYEAMVLDLWMPEVSGEMILERMTQEYPEIPIIILTGINEVETAVRCMRAGAFDFIVKPVERARLLTAVERAIQFRALSRENARLRQGVLSPELEHPEAFEQIVTNSPAMKAIFKYAEAVASSQQSVLITGETGVGKELVARAIHVLSGRKGALVPVNVAGLDDSVFADTLFGHQRGAFTGAVDARPGLIERAAGGTLLLDEIGDLTVASQVKLLRLLQEREYLPLGSDLPHRTDARIVVATNEELEAKLADGRFRKDLFFRLKTHQIRLPPLRERKEDLPCLLDHFLAKAATAQNRVTPTPPTALLELLRSYEFPGNVRELEGMVFDAVSNHTEGMLSTKQFSKAMGRVDKSQATDSSPSRPLADSLFSDNGHLPTLKEAERDLISEALKRAAGNQSIAAGILGISRQALNRRINQAQS